MKNNKIQPKVSIITVCYNEIANIENTCKSVVSQDYKNYEWIVVDGVSIDGTLEVLDQYKEYITTLVSEEDSGVFNAMNKGIKIACGEYLIFLNGGDFFYKSSVLSDVFGENQYRQDVLYGDCCVWLDKYQGRIVSYPKEIERDFFLKDNINHQSTFIRGELFEKYGYYDEKLKAKGDHEKWLRFLKEGVFFQKLPFVISNFHWFDGISSGEKTRGVRDKEFLQIIEKYFTVGEVYRIEEREIERLNKENRMLENSKSFRFGDLFFRSIKNPYKLLVFPINFIKILFK